MNGAFCAGKQIGDGQCPAGHEIQGHFMVLMVIVHLPKKCDKAGVGTKILVLKSRPCGIVGQFADGENIPGIHGRSMSFVDGDQFSEFLACGRGKEMRRREEDR